MDGKEPVCLGKKGLKMNQAKDQSFYINEISSEKNLQQNSTECGREEEEEGKVISQDGDV
jgi:hypothetical protein